MPVRQPCHTPFLAAATEALSSVPRSFPRYSAATERERALPSPLPARRTGSRPTVLERPLAAVTWRQTVPISALCLTRVAPVSTARSPQERRPLAMQPLSLAVPASAPEEVALCRCVRFARWTRARPLRHRASLAPGRAA